MKIQVGIVSYNNPVDLNNLIHSLLVSDLTQHMFYIEVINNHSNFILNPAVEPYVHVIHNTVRPDWSTGHISKDYNSILVRGFQDLDNPDADLVIIIQEDNIVKPDFISRLIGLHNTYNYIASGIGGQLMSFTPEAIKKIGLFDERISSVGSHDTDYFVRAIIWNRAGSSINDVGQERVINPSTNDVNYGFHHSPRSDSDLIQCVAINQDHHNALAPIWKSKPIHITAFNYIWGNQLPSTGWSPELIDHIEQFIRPVHKQIIMYPYFENKIENPSEKFAFF